MVEFGLVLRTFAENLSGLREFVQQVGSLLEERTKGVVLKYRHLRPQFERQLRLYERRIQLLNLVYQVMDEDLAVSQ